jgi:hypothetical protein
MKIIATQSIYDGERLYPADTVIDWPESRPLPLTFEVRPATDADAAAVHDALAQQHARRIALQEQACREPNLQPQVAEIRQAALTRYREEFARHAERVQVKAARGGKRPAAAKESAELEVASDPLT